MPLTAGARLGPYEIVSALGAGGMGEVYKARDTRLDRIVAIKILSSQFADDADRRARFEREAHAVAALNHPHICNLHDVGDAPNPQSQIPNPEPVRFLVMEYLEGQTLEERLLRGPLPPADVLRYAIELADALDHAHRRGLVHRDLKPGNVMLTKSGAKLLDFGISRLQAPPDLLALATVTAGSKPLTAEGAVLGTYPYMAPEQLTGRDADARSDIFAFGAMLYEMATGRRAFEGTTAATVIGAILHTDPPPVSALQPVAPPTLDRLVARCLAKDPDDRWQTARDLMLELKWIAEHAAAPVPALERRTNKKLALIASAVLAVLAITASAFTLTYVRRAPTPDNPVVQLPFLPPDGVTLADVRIGGPVTISPDGQRLAFVAAGADGKQLLWVRPLRSLDAQALAGSEGGAFPFWSPDSQSIGFFAQGKLKRIQASGGPAQTLCDAIQPRGGAWSRNEVIVFAATTGFGLFRVPASGGIATPLPADGVNQERLWPSFLPDGRHFVYFGRTQKEGIYVASVDSSQATLLLTDYAAVAYAPGYLLALPGSSPARTLMAFPFDATSRRLTGPGVPVATPIDYRSGAAIGVFSVSETGTLVYGSLKRSSTQLIWFDRGGETLGNVGGPVAYRQPSLSPDEKTIAVVRSDPETPGEDLWLIDRSRDVGSRFTYYGNLNFMPVWSPDGTRIVFASPRDSSANLFQKTLTATGTEERLFESTFNTQPTDWSPDSKFIVYASLHPTNGWDLMLLPMSGASTDRKPEPLLVTPYDEHLARISPDGRWLAYMSDESGTFEVYVRPFRQPGVSRRLISNNGGTAPRWRGDGRELFYLALDGTLMVVNLTPGANLAPGEPARLFKTRIADRGVSEPLRSPLRANYSVTRDGQRFLIDTVTDESDTVPATVVLNWPAALRQR